MQSDVNTISEHSTVREVVEEMIKAHTNGLVVVDKQHKVVGMLSSWDIIAYVVPDYLEEDKHLAAFESGDVFAERIKEVENHHVSKFMSTHVHTTKASHTLMEAATLLSEFHIRQLPVVDDNGVLVGYLNRTDLKRAIGDVLGLQE